LPEGKQPWTSYEEWLATIPSEMAADSLWKMDAHRLALFAADLGWYDVTRLMQDRRTLGESGPVCRLDSSATDSGSEASDDLSFRFHEIPMVRES
jgi:hypothetical protein